MLLALIIMFGYTEPNGVGIYVPNLGGYHIETP